jgi:hypothetical protein
MRRSRGNLIVGLLLVLTGSYLLAAQFFPQLKFWETFNITWAVWIILLAVALFVLGLLVGAPGMAVPAAIVGGIGCILWYQSVTGDFASWLYLWTLIPGFVGVGMLVAGLLEGRLRATLGAAIWLIVISLVLLIIFGGLFGAGLVETYWPVGLIAIGILILVQPVLSRLGSGETA